MLERFIPVEVVKFHWSSLEDRSDDHEDGRGRSDRPVKVVLVLAPCLAAGIVIWRGLELQAPGPVLAALSLLSAGLLAAFGQIASIRSRYRLPDDAYDPDKHTREMLDEAVAHVLTAALLSVSTALLIVLGMNIGGSAARLPVWATAIVLLFGTYLSLLFLMVIRKLWGAYEVANELDQRNSYLHR